MQISTLLLVILVLILIGVFPVWPHTQNWGYAPSGTIAAVFIILLVLILLGRV